MNTFASELQELIEKWDGAWGTPTEELVDALEAAAAALVEKINARD
jgi:hypothetical protein